MGISKMITTKEDVIAFVEQYDIIIKGEYSLKQLLKEDGAVIRDDGVVVLIDKFGMAFDSIPIDIKEEYVKLKLPLDVIRKNTKKYKADIEEARIKKENEANIEYAYEVLLEIIYDNRDNILKAYIEGKDYIEILILNKNTNKLIDTLRDVTYYKRFDYSNLVLSTILKRVTELVDISNCSIQTTRMDGNFLNKIMRNNIHNISLYFKDEKVKDKNEINIGW